MALIERLYEWKHGNDSTTTDRCANHNYGEWESVDRDGPNPHDDWKYDAKLLAVKYQRTSTGSYDDSPDKASVVPYDEVAEIWCKLSGNQYAVMVSKRAHVRECHCGARELQYRPVSYVAFHCGEILTNESSWDDLEQALIEHDSQF